VVWCWCGAGVALVWQWCGTVVAVLAVVMVMVLVLVTNSADFKQQQENIRRNKQNMQTQHSPSNTDARADCNLQEKRKL